jgi:hypothetical protein
MSMDARVDALRWRELPESWCSTADGEVCALRSVGADVSGKNRGKKQDMFEVRKNGRQQI